MFIDVKKAHVNAKCDEEGWVALPDEFERFRRYAKLKKDKKTKRQKDKKTKRQKDKKDKDLMKRSERQFDVKQLVP